MKCFVILEVAGTTVTKELNDIWKQYQESTRWIIKNKTATLGTWQILVIRKVLQSSSGVHHWFKGRSARKSLTMMRFITLQVVEILMRFGIFTSTRSGFWYSAF
jgi:hypothetical protein